MKFEGNPNARLERIDREKANRPRVVRQLPSRAEVGDLVVFGSYSFMWVGNEWQQLGILEGDARVVAEAAVASAPAAARVEGVQIFNTVEDYPASLLRQYEQGRPPRENFGVRWYADAAAFAAEEEVAADMRPADVSFSPARPVQAEGTHLVTLTFTPVVQNSLLGEIYLF